MPAVDNTAGRPLRRARLRPLPPAVGQAPFPDPPTQPSYYHYYYYYYYYYYYHYY